VIAVNLLDFADDPRDPADLLQQITN